MSKFEAFCDVLKSDGGPAIIGVGAVGVIVGGYYLSKCGYKAEVKNGDKCISLAPPEKESGSDSKADS